MKDVTFKLDVFEKIVNRSYEAIIIVNESREIVFWNQSAEKIFGYTSDMVIGRDMHSLITPHRYRERANKAHERYVQTGKGKVLGKRVEIEAMNCMGQEFWVELSVNDVMVDGARWAFAIIRDISERKKLERMLEYQAQTDPLSGLYNRRAFQYYLDNAIDNCVSVAFIDGDNFKRINDTLGHETGDRVITQVAMSIKKVFADAICTARVGGDEFAVILAETNKERLAQRYQELLTAVQENLQPVLGDEPAFSISIGVVTDQAGKANPRMLLTQADRCLYESKSQGGSRATLRDFTFVGG